MYDMARFKDRERAVSMRQDGHTYSHIRQLLKVSKGSLSLWLRDVRLSKEQLEYISKDKRVRQVETYIRTVRVRQERIRQECYERKKMELGKLSKRDLLMAGLFLYLGEGTKAGSSNVSISNSDPRVIRFSVYWLTHILHVKRSRLKVSLHLYKNMNIEQEINFWSIVTRLQRTQFAKPYIKESNSDRLTHFSFGHGTCNIRYGSVALKREIMASIQILLETAGSVTGHVV